MLGQILFNGFLSGSIYAAVAMGFTIIYNSTGFFNFAHGAVFTIGAYIAYTCFILLKLNFNLSLFLATIGAGSIGVLINQLVYKPLRQQKASNLVFLVASFGLSILLQNLIQLFYGAQNLTLATGEIKEGRQILGAFVTDNQILILLSAISLNIALILLIKKTKLGKAMQAVTDDPIAAEIVGINSEKVITISFFIGSALAGAAGVLISLETNLEPTMGMNAVLKGVIASIIGGMGIIPGALLGGIFLGLTENIGTFFTNSGWKDGIAFSIMIIFLLFRENGILGKPSAKERL
jgi:branched-chain amino acid transport system permease protein